MPYNQQVSPISIAIDCLNSTKYLALRDTYGAMESATPQMKQAYSRMTQEHLAMQEEWFRLMNSRGWYQVSQARPELAAQTMSQIQNIIAQARGTAANIGQQQYQQQQFTPGQFR
ncbi:MAG: spore coat protein [Bacillota bacterium]